MFFQKKKTPSFSVGITTFASRFKEYFIPLLSKIQEYEKGTEVVVAINGEHGASFDEQYRSEVLEFISKQKNTFPVMFPQFRGLAKLWNSIIITSSNDFILMLNDDIMIKSPDFFPKLRNILHKNKFQSFILNNSWSHFMAAKKEIEEVGFFDERLLGIGEEDGDMTWRYIEKYGRPVSNFKIKGIDNFSERTMRNVPQNIKTSGQSKYSLFNKDFISQKYAPDPNGIQGMFDQPVVMDDSMSNQYPYEVFFRNNRDKL